jgi:hypothetical protein
VTEVLPNSKDHVIYDAANGILVYNGTSSGFLRVAKTSATSHYITTERTTSADDAVLKSVAGVFVSDPDQVMSALKASATEGRKEFKLDGRTVVCLATGESQSVIFTW